jgi:hypothetical protein
MLPCKSHDACFNCKLHVKSIVHVPLQDKIGGILKPNKKTTTTLHKATDRMLLVGSVAKEEHMQLVAELHHQGDDKEASEHYGSQWVIPTTAVTRFDELTSPEEGVECIQDKDEGNWEHNECHDSGFGGVLGEGEHSDANRTGKNTHVKVLKKCALIGKEELGFDLLRHHTSSYIVKLHGLQRGAIKPLNTPATDDLLTTVHKG